MIEKEIEKHNLKAIKRLNQRGGRMLSIVDLLEDGTVDRKVIKFLVRRLWAGDSVLAAAGPSGTGKTTFMGALLNLIPPGIKIQTSERGNPVKTQDSSSLYMAHEINDAPYFGYIWGDDARKFLESAKENQIVATLHAESLTRVREKLTRNPVGLSPENFDQIDLVVTMKKRRKDREILRRVDKIYGFLGGEHLQLFKWKPGEDHYEDIESTTYLQNRDQKKSNLDLDRFLNQLLSRKPRRLNEVRGLLLEFVS